MAYVVDVVGILVKPARVTKMIIELWNIKKLKSSSRAVLELSIVNQKLKWTHSQCSKIGKKCNFKSAKKHYLHFQKWQKINFCTRKKFKIAFLVVLNFFVVQKLIFCHFWNCKKCVFVLLKLHFFLILEHCASSALI